MGCNMWRHILNDTSYERRVRRAIGRDVREIMEQDGEPCEDEPDVSVLPPLPPREVRVKRPSVWRHIAQFFEDLLYH